MAKKTEEVQIEEASSEKEKQKVLEVTKENLEKKFGKGSIMLLSEKNHMDIETVPSGSLLLDDILGVGGYPKGRIIEVYGPESSGKTTLTLHAIAEVQRLGGYAAFIDAEHAFDPSYAQKIGVRKEKLYISQPDSGEQALEIAENLARSKAIDIIVIDSVAALVPEAEIRGEMGQLQVGTQARLMSQALRKLSSVISKSNSIVFFINQIRMKIGVMFGTPETTTGGNALKFYSSIRLEVRKGESITEGENVIGHKMNIKVAKNKVAPPFKRTSLDIYFGEGISKIMDLIEAASKFSVISKSGSWYSYKEEKIGQGKDNVKKYLQENPELLAKIENEVRAYFKVDGKDSSAKVEESK